MKQPSSLSGLALWLLFVLLSARTAHARSAGARLEYARSDRAVACPDQEALKAAVAKRLGYDPFLPAARQIIVVEITNADPGLRGQIRLVDDQGIIVGSRELSERAEHCEELVASLALAISIALDPSAVKDDAAPAAPPSSTQAAEAEPPGTVSPEPEPAPALAAPRRAPETTTSKPSAAVRPPHIEEKRSRFALRASGFAALGTAPDPAFGVRLGASSTWAWLRLVADISDQVSASKANNDVGTAAASLLSIALAPCLVYASISGCIVLDVGSLHVQGKQVLDANSERLFNATLGARFEFAPVLIGRLHLLSNVGISTALTPVSLKIHGQKLWDSPPLAATLGIGLGWQL